MRKHSHAIPHTSDLREYRDRLGQATNIPVGNSRATRGSALTTPPSSAPPSTVTHADERAARLSSSVPKSRAATQFSSRVVGGLVASHQPSCQGGRQRRERQPQAGVTGVERHATNCSGPAHGEHPVVNGKAGVLSAQGSTPPSSTNSSEQTSPSQQGEKP